MHGRIIGNFGLKFVLLALPTIGILRADSIAWNALWWLIYLAWGAFFAKREILTKTIIGTMWAQIPFVILLDAKLNGSLLWIAAGLWAGMVYWYIYRQAALLNRPLPQPVGRDA